MISFSCPTCHKTVETDQSLAGKSSVCRSCGAFVTVPFITPSSWSVELRCPKCTARMAAGAEACGFCGHSVAPPAPAPVRDPRRIRVAFLLAWSVAALIVGLSFLGTPAAAPLVAPEQVCRGNLELLHAAVVRFSRMREEPPKTKGTAFWQVIAEAESEGAALACPLDAARNVYRGPAGPWAKIPDTGVIACDAEGVHPDGIRVLLKNGQIESAAKGSDLYLRALRETAE